MKIGVYIEGSAQDGGGFSHQLNVLKILSENLEQDHEFLIFCLGSESAETARLKNFAIVLLKQGYWTKLRRLLSRQRWIYKISAIPLLARIVQSPLESDFSKHGVDLVYFPRPSVAALEMSEHNYIFTVWDLCHLEQPEFPEVRSNREFERREEFYKRATQKAFSVIVDSNFGEKLVTYKYQLEPERVIAIPFLPSEYTHDFKPSLKSREAILLRYGIRLPYIFYPAQFWAHKNHIYLLKTIQRLRDKHGLEIQAVFAGGDKGNLEHVLNSAVKMGISDLVKSIGFAEDEHMPYLFENALALTMPTYFGPTNIPPLDAFVLGCPVCYSDLPSFRVQLGDSAFFMDLADPDSLVAILLELHQQPEKANEKVRLGKKYIEQWDNKKCWDRLAKILSNYEQKQACWK